MNRSIGRMAAIWLAVLAVAVPGTAVMAQDSRADRIEAAIETAQEAQDAQKWGDAARAWTKVTEHDPENGGAWFNLGYCLHADGQLEKAIKIHRRASRFDDYRGIALYNLGCAYALVGREGQAFDALEASEEAGFDVAGHAAEDSDLSSLRGDARFKRYARSRPPRGGGGGGGGAGHGGTGHGGGSGGNAWTPRGGDDLGAMVGEVFGVIRSFLAENAPKTEGMFLELAQHAAKTMQMLHKELSQNENFAPIAEMIGQWMGSGRGHDQGAMARRQQAQGHDHDHAHDQNDAHDHDDRARARDHDGRRDLPLRERTESRPAGDAQSLAEAAQRHQRAGEWSKAIKAWRALVEQEPDIGGAWFSLGYALHAKGDLEEAVRIHKKAAQFEEFEGIATYNLGCAYALLGQKDRAFRALRAAHEAGFDLAGAMPGDSDLESLRSDRRYEELLDRARER